MTSDYVQLNHGYGGERAATDKVGDVHFQRVKLTLGDDGVDGGDVHARNLLPVGIGDGANLDAFSRLRVSDPVGLFSAQCRFDAEPLLFEAGSTGTGTSTPTHSASTRMVELSATAGTGTEFIQSYEYIPYQAGKSQLVFVTGLLGAAVAGAVVDVGLFDAANGLFLRQNGTNGLSVVRRTSTSGEVVDNAVPQAEWNIDKLDGTGRSGFTLDVTKVFILVIDCQFLGMGRVRFGFDIDGQVVYVHEFRNANTLAVPYMQTLTLPVQMLLTTTATATTKAAYFKCASVSSEGGFADDYGYTFSTPEVVAAAGNTVPAAILSMRPSLTFNTFTNRTRLRLDSISMIVTGNVPVYWQLCVGSTFSVAPTFTAVNATYCSADYSSAPGTLSGVGLVIASGYLAASAQVKEAASARISNKYPLTLDRAGAVRALGTLTLVATGLTAASAMRAAFNFTEVR